MEHTGLVIGKESWLVLRAEPLYSARFIDREGTNELAVVVRVEVLDWFVEAYPPLTLNLITWCSALGTWVVVVSYQLHPSFGEAKGGTFYLNPCQPADAELLRKLLHQETLAVVFLSEDCDTHYTVGVMLDPQEVSQWRQRIEQINQALSREPSAREVDADFALAVRELQDQR